MRMREGKKCRRNKNLARRTALKSASLNVGAVRLATLCREVEALGRKDVTDGLAGLTSTIEAEYPAVQSALEEMVETIDSDARSVQVSETRAPSSMPVTSVTSNE